VTAVSSAAVFPVTKGLDWLDVKFPAPAVAAVIDLVESVLGPGEDSERGFRGYHKSRRWKCGAVVGWNGHGGTCKVSLPGGALSFVSVQAKFDLVKAFGLLEGVGRRVDPNVDVSRDRLSVQQVEDAARAGNFRGFRTYDVRRPVFNGRDKGHTVYFGRRGGDGSGRYFRGYDKYLESGGVVDVVRLEVELTGDVAELAFGRLVACATVEEFSICLGELLCGSIDFVDKAHAHRHADRMPRLTWWAWIVEQVGSAPLRVDRAKPALQRTMEYHSWAFCRSLALFYEVAEEQGADGDSAITAYARRLVQRGRGKIKPGEVEWCTSQGLDVDGLSGSLQPDAVPI
jgi:hypothetical protein